MCSCYGHDSVSYLRHAMYFFLELIFPHYNNAKLMLISYTLFLFAEIEVRDSKNKYHTVQSQKITQLQPEHQFREVDETFAVLSKGD